MHKLFTRFLSFPFFVQVIWVLCLVGMCTNAVVLGRDIFIGGILWRLHFGFLLLYAGQTVFILAKEKYVVLLTILQAIIALLTTFDFIFVPLLQPLGYVYYQVCSPGVEALKVYQYVFVSLAFTLQMASVAYLWGYLRQQPTEEA